MAGGLLTMALVDAPVQEWTADPDHGSSTADDIANVVEYFGQAEVVLPVTGRTDPGRARSRRSPACCTPAIASVRRSSWPAC